MIYDSFAILNCFFPSILLHVTIGISHFSLIFVVAGPPQEMKLVSEMMTPIRCQLYARSNRKHNKSFSFLPQANNTFKRPSPDPYIGNDSPNRNNSTMKPKAPPARKPKASKKKKKKDPNEPQK